MSELKTIKELSKEFVEALNFKCKGCGKCCYPKPHKNPKLKNIIPILTEEVATIRRAGKGYGIKPYHKLNGIAGYLKVVKDNKCIYLDKNKKCKIYEIKPLVCILHPFQFFTAAVGGNILDTNCLWVIHHPDVLINPSNEIIRTFRELHNSIIHFKLMNKIKIDVVV